MSWRRWLVISVILVLVGGLVAYGFIPQPLLVETITVARGPLQVIVEAEGKTRIKERYTISAPVAGSARRIELDVGDSVSQGQIVAWLEPLRSAVLDPRSRAEAQARLSAAQAGFQVAQENAQAAAASVDFAVAEMKRLRRLRETGVISQEALDRVETEAQRAEAVWRSARSAIEVAKFEQEAARSALQYSAAHTGAGTTDAEAPELVTLTAPVTGRVLKVHQRSEYVVNPGQALLEIGDPRELEVEVDVLSADAVQIQPGGKVLFKRWGGGDDLEGQVRVIEPVGFTKISALGVEEQRVLVIADFVSEPERWQRLGDGYRVDANFILWQGDQVLQVPTSTLLRDQEGWAVYVVEDGKARLQKVDIGQRSGLQAEVTSGLAEDDIVITHPGDAVADGIRVALWDRR